MNRGGRNAEEAGEGTAGKVFFVLFFFFLIFPEDLRK